MSVAFNTKSSEMSYNGLDLIENDGGLKNQRRCINSERWVRPAGVCSILMVLSLLIVILIFTAQSTRTNSAQSITQVPTSEDYKIQNLTFQWIQLQNKYQSLDKEKDALKAERDIIKAERDALKPERDALIGERDQMRESNNNLTEEMEVLRTRYDGMLKNMQDALNEAGKVCPDQWVKFQNSCYYLSEQPKRWLTSKSDCENKNGHLVVIDSKQENAFVSRFFVNIWIGLSDRAKEGKWKWVNGKDLEDNTYWGSGEPNDSSSNEDCAELLRSSKQWNDVPCEDPRSFICEM